jgi:hypothetical protein
VSGAALEAGFAEGDILVAIDGRPVSTSTAFDSILESRGSMERVRVVVERVDGNQELELAVLAVPRPAEAKPEPGRILGESAVGVAAGLAGLAAGAVINFAAGWWKICIDECDGPSAEAQAAGVVVAALGELAAVSLVVYEIADGSPDFSADYRWALLGSGIGGALGVGLGMAATLFHDQGTSGGVQIVAPILLEVVGAVVAVNLTKEPRSDRGPRADASLSDVAPPPTRPEPPQVRPSAVAGAVVPIFWRSF